MDSPDASRMRATEYATRRRCRPVLQCVAADLALVGILPRLTDICVVQGQWHISTVFSLCCHEAVLFLAQSHTRIHRLA